MLKISIMGPILLIPNAGVMNKSIYKENNKDVIETQLFNPIQSNPLNYTAVKV